MARTKTKYPNILFDDSRKLYYVTFDYGKDANGIRVKKTKTFKLLKDAREELSIFQGKKAANLAPIPSEMTLSQLLDLWYEDKKKYDEATSLYNYKNIIERHIKPILGNVLICELTAKHLNEYFVFKAKKDPKDNEGLAYNTMERHREVFVSAFKFAIQEQKLRYNIIQEVKPLCQLIKKSKTNFKHNILSVKESKEFLKSLDGNFFRMAYLIAAETGLRRGEILGLKWDQCNLDDNYITVEKTRTQAGNLTIEKGPKSVSGYRTLKITDTLSAELKQCKNKYDTNKLRYGDKFNDSNLVICHPNGKACAVNSIDNNLAKLRKRLNLRYFRLHDLRHTALSFLYHNGMNDVQVAQVAGHAKASYTRDIYLGNPSDPSPIAANLMNRLLYTDEFEEIPTEEDFVVIDENSPLYYEVSPSYEESMYDF